MKIADLFFGAFLDDSGLLKQVKTSGDKAGQLLGATMGSAASVALRGGMVALAGGAAIAFKGLQELDGITAKFAASTGASAEEAKRAGQAINEMAGRNLQPLSEIGDALTVVHTDLGLTGAAAEKTTEQFLKFATATNQNAAAAVKSFDDILDAWGLTAEDAQGIMDKLIVSHQKYGGSIEENQKALASFAPQLRALNATIDDGIGLLNLFAASGLDASAATKALNTAVSKLKPGQNLNDLVAEITAIEDPTKRAQKAIEIFGSKGGVALANALKPGVHGLQDFEVSAQDAAGATQKASDAIEGTFSNQIALRIKAVGSAIIGVGQSVGPLLTGLAGLASLGGSLGLDKVLVKGFEGLAHSSVIHGAAEKAGLVIGGVYGAAMGEATKIAEIAAEKWNEVLQSSAVKVLASKAGTVVGALYGAALGVATKLSEIVADIFVKLPFAPAVRAAVLASAIEMGTLQATAFGQAVLGFFAAAPLVIPMLLVPKIQDLIPKPFPDADPVKILQKQIEDGTAPKGIFAQTGQKVGTALADGIHDGLSEGQDHALKPLELYGDAMIAAARDAFPRVANTFHTFAGKIADDLSGVKFAEVARHGALLLMGKWAQGFRDGRDAVDTAWQDMLDGLKKPISVTAETAKLLGELASKKLIQGMHSYDPAVKDQANYTKQLILDRLEELKPRAGTLSKAAMANLRKAMKSADPDIRTAATEIYNAAVGKGKGTGPSDLPASGTAYGEGLVRNLAAGMTNNGSQNALRAAAAQITGIARNYMQLGSPAKEGPWSKKGGPEGWGASFTRFLALGMEGAADHVTRASNVVATAAVPSIHTSFRVPTVGTPAVGMAGAGWSTNATTIVNNNVSVIGAPKAQDPLGVARQLQRLTQVGGFTKVRK